MNTVNAIQRLRHVTFFDWVAGSPEERDEVEAALAAVETLYQAAKELVDDGRESLDNPMWFYASAADAAALAAAVRRVEGEA